MEYLQWLLDDHLLELTAGYGMWVYAILVLIVFCETGLVVTPFLPGDSLVFAVGTLTATGALDLTMSIVLLLIAAVLGDTVNYWIGARVGPKVFTAQHSRFFILSMIPAAVEVARHRLGKSTSYHVTTSCCFTGGPIYADAAC
jgi:membrane protein DedA with SNARE-associated domain